MTNDKTKAITSDLMAFKEAFDEAKIPWVIIGGIVLGYARYKEIMPWDTDVDIGLFTELSDFEWEKLLESLHKKGLKFPSEKVDFMYCYRETECNIDWYHRGDNGIYSSFPKSTPKIKFIEKAKYLDNVQYVDFLGDQYPMPGYIEEFVADHYGADWRTNIIKDHDIYFSEKRGSRKDQSTWFSGRASKDGDLWPKVLKRDDDYEL